MPIRLVAYPLADGRKILVEEAVEDHGGLAGRGDVVETARQSFQDALATLRPAVAAVIAQVEGLARKPDEIGLEIGFSLKGEVGAVIARTAADGSFKLSLKWRPSG
jgi:DNA-directed RNA polymerase specialized sigma24 family protein